VLLQVVDDVVALVHRDATLVVDENGDLALPAGRDEFVVRLFVSGFSCRRARVVDDV